jgi:SHS2 domain-containing protein
VSNSYFETFEHGADIGIRGVGETLQEAFIQGAKALFAITLDNLEQIRPVVSREIEAASYDLEGLFVAWLNALIAEADVHNMLFCAFEVNLYEHRLSGMAWGEEFDTQRHELGVEVKGATFTQLFVGQKGGRWITQCVVDV